MNCPHEKENSDCLEMTVFDAIVQINPTEANIFSIDRELILGENRDASLGELPSESEADPDKNLPYVKRIDCSSCGEKMEMTNAEIEKMNLIFKTFKIQLSMYGSVAERADIKITAQSEQEAVNKALKMSENCEIEFTNNKNEAMDGWNYQVEEIVEESK